MRQRKVKNLEGKLEAVREYMIEDPSPGVWQQAFGTQRLEGPRGLFLEIGCGKGDFLLQQALAHPESDFVGIEGQASVVLRAMEKAARIEAGAPDEDDPDWLREAVAAGGEEHGSDTDAASRSLTEAQEEGGADTDAASRSLPEAREEGGADTDAASRSLPEVREEGGSPANSIGLSAGGTPLPNVRFACAFVNSLEDLFDAGSLSGVYLNFSDPWPKGRHARRRLTYRGRLRDYAKALKPGGFIAFKTDNDDLFDFTLEEIEACGWTPREMTRDLHGDGCGYEARRIMTEYERKFHEAGRHINYVKVTV